MKTWMPRRFPPALALCACLAVTALGCRRKGAGGPASPELDKAVTALASAEPAPALASAPVPSPGTAPAQEAPPALLMKQAAEAYKGGQLEEAVTQLQKLRATTTMTAQQRMALNDAMAAVMGDIYALAAKGDGRAIQAVKQYEKLQNQRR